MAAWQVEFHVIPRRALALSGAAISPGGLDASWWTSHELPPDYQRRLSALVPMGTSADTARQTWGTEDGNRIDTWSEGGRVTMVVARVDVRKLDSKFGAALLQFVRIADAVLVRSDGLIIEPEVGAFAAALRSSKAWRFGNDPAKYLSSSSADDDDE